MSIGSYEAQPGKEGRKLQEREKDFAYLTIFHSL
jgi:hypothetical protein